MNVKQVFQLVNDATNEVLGTEALLQEDLSNVVDVGTEIFNNNAFDNYVKTLINHIGRVIFVNRPYRGSAPSVLMDGWEYGSVMQKIQAELPEATETEDWLLTNGTSYDPNIFHKPKASSKFFNKRTTFEIDRSITEMQVKESFSSPEQLNAFISMLFNEVDKSLTVKTDALIMRTINNFIGATFYEDFPTGNYSANTTARCVNLLKLYNDKFSKTATPENVLYDPDFIRFASMEMSLYYDRLSKISKLFNIGGMPRFTTPDLLHFVMLNDFQKSANVYLQSDTFHNEYTKLPNAESVPYWQGSGLEYSFGDISEINVTTADGHNVHVSGILGVMFDRDALGVANVNKRVTTNYNPKGEFTNYFYKQDAMYFNDYNENFVVFYIA
jgi:hypothetical protein